VRPAEAAEAGEIARILQASIRELCGADHDGEPAVVEAWTRNKTPEAISRWIADPRNVVLVGGDDSGAIGVVGAFRGDTVLLNYVAPAFRFRNLTNVMLLEMEQMMAEAGVTEGKLASTRTAHRFYRDRGWQDSGPLEMAYGIPGQPMTKRLR
jgi:hypothetical protein